MAHGSADKNKCSCDGLASRPRKRYIHKKEQDSDSINLYNWKKSNNLFYKLVIRQKRQHSGHNTQRYYVYLYVFSSDTNPVNSPFYPLGIDLLGSICVLESIVSTGSLSKSFGPCAYRKYKIDCVYMYSFYTRKRLRELSPHL